MITFLVFWLVFGFFGQLSIIACFYTARNMVFKEPNWLVLITVLSIFGGPITFIIFLLTWSSLMKDKYYV